MFGCFVNACRTPFSVSLLSVIDVFVANIELLVSFNCFFMMEVYHAETWIQWLSCLYVITGTGTTSSSAQGTSGTGVTNANLSHHQARVRAAAAAASIYEKSYVYPCASTLVWYVFSFKLCGLCFFSSSLCWSRKFTNIKAISLFAKRKKSRIFYHYNNYYLFIYLQVSWICSSSSSWKTFVWL